MQPKCMLKAEVPLGLKERVEKHAEASLKSGADVVREALLEYLPLQEARFSRRTGAPAAEPQQQEGAR